MLSGKLNLASKTYTDDSSCTSCGSNWLVCRPKWINGASNSKTFLRLTKLLLLSMLECHASYLSRKWADYRFAANKQAKRRLLDPSCWKSPFFLSAFCELFLWKLQLTSILHNTSDYFRLCLRLYAQETEGILKKVFWYRAKCLAFSWFKFALHFLWFAPSQYRLNLTNFCPATY